MVMIHLVPFFSISRYTNLIISDLHAELPHLDVKFNLKEKDENV